MLSHRYPKQRRLLSLKKAAVSQSATTPYILPSSSISLLTGAKFDVILIDPPFSSAFTWDDLAALPVPSLAADPSFVFLWVGSGAGEGLERGREVLGKWGYRRCEDVVWVRTNREGNKGPGVRIISHSTSLDELRLTPSFFPDRPSNNLPPHPYQTTLPRRHPRHRPPFHRRLVRALQRRSVPSPPPSNTNLTQI